MENKKIIFKTIKTYKNHYVYDRHTNSIVTITGNEYDELNQVDRGELPAGQSPVIAKYQSFGMFAPNVVEKIEHPKTEVIEHHAKNKLDLLTLQVTQQCNLRCAYCAFSGIYEKNRTHSGKRMSLETAKKAIDFFLDRSTEKPEITIGFYGGEPLLEFDLIQKTVTYAKSKTEGRKIQFNMTTNGTLLSQPVVDYLVEEGFNIAISLDGSKEEHDTNRKFANGQGSFDVIIRNIKNIKERYPAFYNRLQIMTTINPYIDLGCVLEYFSTDDVFSDKYIIFNSMDERDLKEQISYNEKYFRIRAYEYVKMLFWLTGKLEDKYISPLSKGMLGSIVLRKQNLHKGNLMSPVMHHNGPCEPGVHRLFVRVDEALFPCERINDQLAYFQIGTLDDGFDLEQMKKILNIGQLTESACRECWNFQDCSICAGQIDFTDAPEPTKSGKKMNCQKNSQNTIHALYEFCVLNEFGLAI